MRENELSSHRQEVQARWIGQKKKKKKKKSERWKKVFVAHRIVTICLHGSVVWRKTKAECVMMFRQRDNARLLIHERSSVPPYDNQQNTMIHAFFSVCLFSLAQSEYTLTFFSLLITRMIHRLIKLFFSADCRVSECEGKLERWKMSFAHPRHVLARLSTAASFQTLFENVLPAS